MRSRRARSTPTTPDRGPLLIVVGDQDHTVPPAIASASYRQYKDNRRGHSLTIDGGWREVAETALAFVKRFV